MLFRSIREDETFLKKNFTEVRKWCVDNLDNDPSVLLRRIYDNLSGSLVPPSIPAAVLCYYFCSAIIRTAAGMEEETKVLERES